MVPNVQILLSYESLKEERDRLTMKKKIGLKDRNNKDIREGDILFSGMRKNDANGWTHEIVTWNEDSQEYDLANRDRTMYMHMQKDQSLRIIRGNIYDNPEMVELVSL